MKTMIYAGYIKIAVIATVLVALMSSMASRNNNVAFLMGLSWFFGK